VTFEAGAQMAFFSQHPECAQPNRDSAKLANIFIYFLFLAPNSALSLGVNITAAIPVRAPILVRCTCELHFFPRM
jgi:hypothetical protein